MEETIKEYVNYTQFTEFTSDAERADHFFEEVPPAADAFQVTKMKGNDRVYERKNLISQRITNMLSHMMILLLLQLSTTKVFLT